MVNRRGNRYYFCNQVDMKAATYSDICFRHQLLISLRLLVLLARKTCLSNLWQIVRWWK